MSYFPEDIPFMSEEERKANGIKTAKEIEAQKTQLSEEDATFDCVSIQQVIERIEWWFEILKQNPDILIDAIKTLPSAHPDIIHCKDCKHWDDMYGTCYCEDFEVHCQDYYIGDMHTEPDFFCGFGKRKGADNVPDE